MSRTIQIGEFPKVMVPDFLQRILKEAKVKSFTLNADTETTHITLHVNMEKVATYSAGEVPVPETFEGAAHIVIQI